MPPDGEGTRPCTTGSCSALFSARPASGRPAGGLWVRHAGELSGLHETAAAGIDFDDVSEYLERDGLAKFEKSWGELGATIAAELERQHHPAMVKG